MIINVWKLLKVLQMMNRQNLFFPIEENTPQQKQVITSAMHNTDQSQIYFAK